MSFESFIGLRYLKAKRKQTFISIITVISVGGVALGVTALIVVLSVMSGFQQDLKAKILGMNAHVIVLKNGATVTGYRELEEKVKELEDVVGVSPFIYSQVMVRNQDYVSGAVLRGIDPKTINDVTLLGSAITRGALDSLDSAENHIIIGKELALNLGTSLGDSVQVISPIGRRTPMGRQPTMETYQVTGLLESGMYEYDSTFAFVSLAKAQEFLGFGDEVTGLEVRVKDLYQSHIVASEISRKLGFPYWAKDWKRMNRNLFSALKLEKITMFIILTLIIIVAAFNIVSTLIMMVMEKNKDIAILKSMGATSKSILKIFLFEGLVIGTIGTAIGLAGGLFLCFLLKRYQFIQLPSDVYYISTLPVRMDIPDIVIVCVSAIAITFLATLYPAWQASRLNPAEVLRYE
ncbi:MAG: lipoprotein-releasing ABC transporter permease subunit [Deltaproteobacteria bacterium]|nr:lipoprotein-releasing ABC transporter permease subunit [Deltaproteobacteria bacterium]